MVEKILNNTTPYRKIRASHEGSLHSSTLNSCMIFTLVCILKYELTFCTNFDVLYSYKTSYEN